MKFNRSIPKTVITRISRYYRYLDMLLEQGISRTSSKDLSARMGLTASQIRQDLNHFGGFGQQGYGYNVSELKNEVGKIIGLNNSYKAILVGAGNLGRAIAQHLNFEKRGFDLIGIFDSDEALTGMSIGGLKVRNFNDIESFCKEEKPVVAILCIPTNAGRAVTEKLEECGINAFWNFSHYNITSDFPEAIAENVHLNDSIMTLCYNISNSEDNK